MEAPVILPSTADEILINRVTKLFEEWFDYGYEVGSNITVLSFKEHDRMMDDTIRRLLVEFGKYL